MGDCTARTRVLVTVVPDNPAAVRAPDEIGISYRPISYGATSVTLCYSAKLTKES